MASNENFLDRERARTDVREQFGEVVGLTTAIVDEGTHVLTRLLIAITSQPTPPKLFHSSLLILLRHVVELTDAADELFHAGIFTAAALQARAILEAYCQMAYMSCERRWLAPSVLSAGDVDPLPKTPAGAAISGDALDAERDRRARAYLVANYRRALDDSARLDTDVATAWFAKVGPGLVLPSTLTAPTMQANLRAEAQRIRTKLSDSANLPIDEEFKRLRGKAKYDPNWYALRGGPANVRALAASVGVSAHYDTLYGSASRVMHATHVDGQLTMSSTGGTVLAPLREADMAGAVCRSVIIYATEAFRLCLSAIRPDELAAWDKNTAGPWMDVGRRIR